MDTDLSTHAQRVRQTPLGNVAAARAGQAVLTAAGWRIDMARQYLDGDSDNALLAFGRARSLEAASADLFGAAIVNPSEGRPALHWALRARMPLKGEAETVRQSVLPALQFARDIRSGNVRTAGGTPFTSIVHIGIGGSDFGPRLIADAFEDMAPAGIDLRLCANVDP